MWVWRLSAETNTSHCTNVKKHRDIKHRCTTIIIYIIISFIYVAPIKSGFTKCFDRPNRQDTQGKSHLKHIYTNKTQEITAMTGKRRVKTVNTNKKNENNQKRRTNIV